MNFEELWRVKFFIGRDRFYKNFINIKFARKYTSARLRSNAWEHVDENSFLLAAISKKRYFCAT